MTKHLVEGDSFPQDYRLDRKLAESHQRTAWIATHERTGERVVIKCLPSDQDNREYEQLRDRIQSLRGLVHPNIVSPRTAGQDEDIDYIIESWVPDARKTGWEDHAWSILDQIISALSYTHSLGIAHGHLHPDNLLITPDGTVHITGFGLPSYTERFDFYQSPQVRAGESPAPADDIYSLGCTTGYCPCSIA